MYFKFKMRIREQGNTMLMNERNACNVKCIPQNQVKIYPVTMKHSKDRYQTEHFALNNEIEKLYLRTRTVFDRELKIYY